MGEISILLPLACCLITFGTLNTVFTNLSNETYVPYEDGSPAIQYHHPAFQTFSMFIGESVCFAVYGIQQLVIKLREKKHGVDVFEGAKELAETKFSQLEINEAEEDIITTSPAQIVKQPLPWSKCYLFIIPTLCDCTGTTLMHLGLILTTPSVYQMLRSLSVVFTAFAARIFLKQKLYHFKLLGIGLIVVGTLLVGIQSVLVGSTGDDAPNPLLGDILICLAQCFVAGHMLTEEYFLKGYEVPGLKAVGLEGVFGMAMTGILLAILQNTSHLHTVTVEGGTEIEIVGPIEDTRAAFYQIAHSVPLLLFVIGSVCSIAAFNFCGMSITKHSTASVRVTIDACRTFAVWLVSLFAGWDDFYIMTLLGFFILVSGTITYNKVVKCSCLQTSYDLETEDESDAKIAAARKAALQQSNVDDQGMLGVGQPTGDALLYPSPGGDVDDLEGDIGDDTMLEEVFPDTMMDADFDTKSIV
ncbi:Solute carrier family 35 member SLC35F1/F2/F6 like protein [Aduncisulcus paluster]|uniref:Solute carrier family 35 member SLC35F1/F2/F6 like protein n=1 Tax=Aduncisulcus paluster TaxID=2918883 RepID=A0ABQ5K2S8_9EUKA|nr:Solute carrier family 35 member SLC35F1/F2/F6 like protein [Aduncisulcus paluster]